MMADVEKIFKSLLEKFESKKYYESRKIVFWYDVDKTVDDCFDELKQKLQEKNIKIVLLNDNNYFEVKKILEYDFPSDDFLVYTKFKERTYEDNWLLDIQLYSSRFENNKVADVKSYLNIDGGSFDDFIEENYSFFKSKARLDSLKQLYSPNWSENDFIKGFFAVLTKTKIIDINLIIRNLLIDSLNESDDSIWEDIKKHNLEEAFWDLVKEQYGYSSIHPNLDKLFSSFIITHIFVRSGIILKGYNEYINIKKNDCEVFLNSWIRDTKDLETYKLFAKNFEERNEVVLKEQFSLEEIYSLQEIEALEFFDKLIILNIINKITDKGQDFSKYKSIIANRKNKTWYETHKNVYCALESAVELYAFITNEKIELKPISELYSLYKNKYYLADYYYRKFYEYYDAISSLDILKKKLRSEIEKLYHNIFLDKLFEVWTQAVDLEKKEHWSIGTNPNQNEFYYLHIDKYIKKGNKVVVLISDALRYEIAHELQDKLNNELRGEINLSDLIGMIPSITKVGMASLLPHKNINYVENDVLCDGLSTQGIKNREKILLNKEQNSLAISYNDFKKYTRQEKRDLLKGKNIIYIYHDVIDSIGDDAKTEHKVCTASKNAIDEIFLLVKDLSLAASISNIIITADHGFIYKRDSLEEFDKIHLNIDKNQIVDSKKRYLVTRENTNIDNTHKFKLNYASEELYAYIPKGPLRFKTQGSGINFVHGGVSPQEIAIPVLTYKHIRSDKDLEKKQIKHGYVNIKLLNQTRKVTTNIITLNLFQTEKVTDKLKPIKCRLSLINPDNKEEVVSDEKEIIINSNSDDAEQRKYSLSLSLKSSIQNKKHYLRIYDVYQEKIIDDIPFEVDLAMSNDFDDF